MSHIVIDTDILIDAGRGIKQALQYIQQCEATRAISVITKMELMVGCRDKNEMHHINKFLTSFQLLNIDEGISTTATQSFKSWVTNSRRFYCSNRDLLELSTHFKKSTGLSLY